MGVDAENEGNGGVIPALELSQLLTSIRNRGSHVLAVIDTSHAAALRLVENQEPLNIWSYKKMLPEEITPKAEERITLRPGAGGLSVFYASKDVQQAGEYERTDGKSYGLFSYSLAAALTTADPGASVRTLALKTKEYMGHVRETRQHPVYQSTDPDAPILAPQQPSSGLKLELHDPPVTRGAIRIGKNKFTVKGRIKQPGKIVDLSINFRSVKPADFDRKTGEFTMRDVEMKPGQNELSVLATFSDFHKEVMVIPVAVEGNLEQIVGSGKQYVLTIANSDYSKTSYTVLKTPGNDVKEISTLLAGQYGFASSIKDRDGNQHNLTLVDASRDKITEVMEVLVDALRPEDSLLVYYAGHGIYDETSQQAFWVPVDGSRRTKLISADELTTRFFANMQARHVLVVSDSCYSGALSRGGDTVKERTGEDRSRYIERMLAKQTRQLLSSGNNEPVADGGGNNHSIFAQALIEGLQEMDETLFTVSDLFYGHIKTRVAGARSANQSPQLQMIKKSGDEGGEFVFKKKKALGTP
ncbi:hypothetical protein GMPD_31970 [Geomonas paludis]|nr:hypothetical protein GMPD_31970 [Geomonas paludis]